MELDNPSTPITDITPITPIDNNEAANSEERPNKRRRKKSIVWEHFTIENVGDGCMRACCKQCKKSFAYITGSKLAGTSHLKRHIALGICPVSRQKNGVSPFAIATKSEPPKKRYRASPGFANIPFDQDRCTHEIAKMIILHDYPLHMVEHPAFIDFVRTLQPQYKMPSFNTIEGDCVAIYLREKQNLFNLINEIPGRLSLTLDLGMSNANIGYAFLTGHFIDGDWNLHRRLLNVVMLPFPDSDYAFNQAVVSCLTDWHLENGLFTLTLDQSFSSETMTGDLRGLISVRNQNVLNGQLLKGNCYARVLSRLAQDILEAMAETIGRVRESVKYVKTSEARDEKFTELRQQLQVPSTKELIIDDQTKWNTTYHMLVAACELKEVFTCLDTCDPVLKIIPSIDDWKRVEVVCSYLKLLFDAANILTGPTYPATNAFYHEVSKIELELTHAAMSEDPFVSNLTRPLKEKFDQYWKDCFLVLAIAVVMDPRFKMKLIEFSFTRLFGEDAGMWIRIADDGIHELFLDYLAPTLSLQSNYVEEGNMGFSHAENPRELVMLAPQDGPSQEVSQQEVHLDEVPLQVVCPVEVPPHEVKPEELEYQEVHSQEDVHFQGVPQEMHPQEVSALEILPEEMHLQDACQDMQTQKASQGIELEEVLAQGSSPQEKDAQVLPPSQQMDTQDEMPPQQVDTQEIPLTQEVVDQEIQPPQEVVNQEVQPPQEADTGEVQPPQDMDIQEVQPPQDIDTPELQPPHEMDSQEIQPPQDIETQEVPPQEMDAKEVASQGMNPSEASPQEVPPQEIHPQEASTQEVSLEEVPSQEVQGQEGVPQDMHTEELHPQEVPDQQVHTQGTVPKDMHPQELPPKEMLAQEESQVMHSQEMPPQGVLSQVMQTQLPSQELHIEEVPPQGFMSHEGPSHEMHTHVLHREIHHQDSNGQDLHLLSLRDGFSDFDAYISEMTNGQHMKSELDQYLEESLLPRVQEFDVLAWWKLNKLKYPTLSRLAADILSIPVSTVGPESVFDTQSKKIDSYHSSLRPVTLEALICSKDWLQYGSSLSMEIPNNAIVKMED